MNILKNGIGNKIVLVVGIIGSIGAAEGLYRFSTLLSAFKKDAAIIYQLMMVLAIVSTIVLILSLLNKSHKIPKIKISKIVLLVALIGSIIYMISLSKFPPVILQCIIGMVATVVATIFIRSEKHD